MLIGDLSDHATLQEAAEALAGNWQHWQCFMWFGSDDVPDSHNVALGYLVNNYDPSVTQLANSEVIKEKMKPWMGKNCGDALVGPFASSVSGDRNALGGIQIRVYDSEGNITEPFRVLYDLCRYAYDSCILDQTVWDEVNERELRRHIKSELEFMCSNEGIPFEQSLVGDCYSCLNEESDGDFNYDYIESEVEEWFDEMIEQRRRDEKNGLHPQHEDIAN